MPVHGLLVQEKRLISRQERKPLTCAKPRSSVHWSLEALAVEVGIGIPNVHSVSLRAVKQTLPFAADACRTVKLERCLAQTAFLISTTGRCAAPSWCETTR